MSWLIGGVCVFGFFFVVGLIVLGYVGFTMWKARSKGVRFHDGVSKDEFALIKESFEETLNIEQSLEKLIKIQQAVNAAISKKQAEKQQS